MAFCAHCGKELPAGATFCPACGTPVQGATASTASPSGAPGAASISGFESLTKDSKAQDYWLRRFVAFVIDAIIVFVVFYVLITIVAVTVTFPFLFAAGGFAPFALIFGTLAILSGVIFILYFTVLEASSGATFGKRTFGLKVKSKTGSNPTLAEAFIRNLSKIYWLLLLLDIIVGLAISKGYQQKYSDTLVGTTVVSTKS